MDECGGGGKGRPAMDDAGGLMFVVVTFLGSVLDLLTPFELFDPLLRNDVWPKEVLLPKAPGESGMEPFLRPFLGGAIGPGRSPFGGSGGREDGTCSSRAYVWKDMIKNPINVKKLFDAVFRPW